MLPESISLTGNQVLLRPLTQQDFQALYEWRNDPEWLYLWSHPRRLVAYTEFVSNLEKSLRSEVDIWLLIISRETAQPIGFVYSYDTNAWDSFTFICMFLSPLARGNGAGKESGALFVRYLMDYFPLRKIYSDIFDFNLISQGFVRDYGFVQEGYFPSHRFYQGKYWGMYRLALYRDNWNEVGALFFG
jgi:RimJ/RimL family protein N-acetyltransferase